MFLIEEAGVLSMAMQGGARKEQFCDRQGSAKDILRPARSLISIVSSSRHESPAAMPGFFRAIEM